MSEHTPGPWRVSGCVMVGLSATDSPLIEHGDEQEGSPLIAEVYTDSDRLPAAANARLIAAAPIMYSYVATQAASGDNEAIKLLEEIDGTMRNVRS